MEHLALEPRARSLSLELFAGDAFAVMGPAGSGRRQFLKVLAGEARSQEGRVVSGSPVETPRVKEYGRRNTPQGVAKSLAKRVSSSRLTQVLSALGLWDVRQQAVSGLAPEQQTACDLLPVFVGPAKLAVIDGELDVLDPWVRESALSLVEEARADGACFVVGTNLTTIAARLGSLVVFQGPSPVYAGTVENLLKTIIPDEIVIETDDTSTVTSMVEPFAVQVRQFEGRVVVQSDKGQELAARLLTQGYGQVRSVVIKEPSLYDALRHLA